MPSTVRNPLILIGLTAVVLFTNLGGPRLWDRDEPRNAGCAAEMLERGDWVVPVFNNELRTHKPVLLYWLTMTAYEMFGVNEFAARFWSAMLGVATVLMTYYLGRRLFNERAGFWAGLSLAPALMFGVASRAATPDAVLVFCSTLALFLYGMFAFRADGVANRYFPPAWWRAALIYAAMGLAILAKGPVGLVLPTAVIGMFLLIMRQPTSTLVAGDWFGSVRSGLGVFGPLHFLRTCWAMRPLTALTISLAIALPWYLWVHARTEGAWTIGFFFEHNLGRATQAMEGHRGNVLFYPAALAIGFFPWSVFFLPMLLDAADQLRRRVAVTPGYLFAACWVGVYLVLFSLAKTKLPSYITPCYPGVALLMGAFASNVITQQSRVALVWMRVSLATAVIVGIALLVGLPQVSARFLPGEEWLGVLGIAPLLAGLLGWYFTARQMFQRAMLTYGASAIAFSTFGLALVTQRVDEHQRNDELLAAIFAQQSHPRIGYYGVLEPTWVFYSGQPLINVAKLGDAQEFTSERSPVPETTQWVQTRRIPGEEFLAGSADNYLIATRRDWDELRSHVSPEIEVLAEVPYFLRGQQQLVALGRRTPAAKTAAVELPERLQRRR